jgi:tRNA (mo5U34)-methyltransferase
MFNKFYQKIAQNRLHHWLTSLPNQLHQWQKNSFAW